MGTETPQGPTGFASPPPMVLVPMGLPRAVCVSGAGQGGGAQRLLPCRPCGPPAGMSRAWSCSQPITTSCASWMRASSPLPGALGSSSTGRGSAGGGTLGRGGPAAGTVGTPPSLTQHCRYDSLTGVPAQQRALAFEKGSVLFNIGALHTQIGARQDRSCAEGARRAMEAFQRAAGEGGPGRRGAGCGARVLQSPFCRAGAGEWLGRQSLR